MGIKKKNKIKWYNFFLGFNITLATCLLKILKCKHAKTNMNSASASSEEFLK